MAAAGAGSRQRASLENLGLVAVEYEFLEDLERDSGFTAAVAAAGVDVSTGVRLVRAVLDVMRKNRAVGFDFFQEYVDPNKKRFSVTESVPSLARFYLLVYDLLRQQY